MEQVQYLLVYPLFFQTDDASEEVSEEKLTKNGDKGQAWEKRLADKDGFFTLTNYFSGKILTANSDNKLEIKGMHAYYVYMNHELKGIN